MRNRFTGHQFLTNRPGDFYGSSNRASDGEPMYEVVAEYDQRNPKIDLYTERGGEYIASTNFLPSVRDALHYYSTRSLMGAKVGFARIDHRK